MAISTKPEISTKEKISLLREKHQPVFDALDVPNALFFPKMAYRPYGKDELFVSFFVNELKREGDIYTEFVSRDYVSEDANRTLWVWRYNPHWEMEYEATEANDLGNVRYLVPVSELIKVNMPEKKMTPSPFKEFGEDLIDDATIDDMTIRDLATIMTGRPLSKKAWLNHLIAGK